MPDEVPRRRRQIGHLATVGFTVSSTSIVIADTALSAEQMQAIAFAILLGTLAVYRVYRTYFETDRHSVSMTDATSEWRTWAVTTVPMGLFAVWVGLPMWFLVPALYLLGIVAGLFMGFSIYERKQQEAIADD